MAGFSNDALILQRYVELENYVIWKNDERRGMEMWISRAGLVPALCKSADAWHEFRAGMNAPIPGTNGRLCTGMISKRAINNSRNGET